VRRAARGRYLQERTDPEIAGMLGMAASAVDEDIARALGQVRSSRTALGPEAGDPGHRGRGTADRPTGSRAGVGDRTAARWSARRRKAGGKAVWVCSG
jgi:hypothetical protein